MRLSTIRKVAMAVVLAMSILTLPPHMVRGSTAYADGSEGKAQLSTYYVGKAGDKGAFTIDNVKPTDPPGKNAVKGEIYWVGIGLTEFGNFVRATTGISGMEIAMNYNPTYLQPCTEQGWTMADVGTQPEGADKILTADDISSGWLDYVESVNFSESAAETDLKQWNKNIYEMDSTMCSPQREVSDGSLYTYTPDAKTDKPTGMKMMYLSVLQKDDKDSEKSRFTGVSSPSATEIVYLMFVPFKVMDTNPTARYLQMSLGPNTFTIEFHTTTEPTYAQWEDSTQERYYEASTGLISDMYNLKAYYIDINPETLNVDLLGYSAQEDEIKDIKIFNPVGGTGEPNANNTLKLYPSLAQNATDKYWYPDTTKEEGFAQPDTTKKEYVAYADITDNNWSKLSVRVSKIKNASDLSMFMNSNNAATDTQIQFEDSAEKPEGSQYYVFKNDEGAQQYIVPAEVKIDKSDNALDANSKGFNNKLTIQHGSNVVYTIYLRLYAVPKIELKPGNSPVGLIMRDKVTFTDDDPQDPNRKYSKTEAINAFKTPSDDRQTRLTYREGMVPVVSNTKQADGTYKRAQTKLAYTLKAWRDFEKNYDTDPDALFVYRGTVIRDPGYEVKDKFNETVESNGDSDAEMKITTTLRTQNQNLYVPDSEVDTKTEELKITELPYDMQHDNDGIVTFDRVRPYVYTLNYYYEPLDLKYTRPLIILGIRGDVHIKYQPGVSSLDGSYVYGNFTSIELGRQSNSLIAYRCMDMFDSLDPVINAFDGSDIMKNWSGYSNDTDNQFYIDLTD